MFEPELKRNHPKLFRNHTDSGHVQIHIYANFFAIALTLVLKPGGYAKAQGLVCFSISKTSAKTKMNWLSRKYGITHRLYFILLDAMRQPDSKGKENVTKDTGRINGQKQLLALKKISFFGHQCGSMHGQASRHRLDAASAERKSNKRHWTHLQTKIISGTRKALVF